MSGGKKVGGGGHSLRVFLRNAVNEYPCMTGAKLGPEGVDRLEVMVLLRDVRPRLGNLASLEDRRSVSAYGVYPYNWRMSRLGWYGSSAYGA